MTDEELALSWKLTAETVQRAYDRLYDAAYVYLTGPSNKTLKALWQALDWADECKEFGCHDTGTAQP